MLSTSNINLISKSKAFAEKYIVGALAKLELKTPCYGDTLQLYFYVAFDFVINY